jgi:hypothetical protein
VNYFILAARKIDQLGPRLDQGISILVEAVFLAEAVIDRLDKFPRRVFIVVEAAL